MSILQGATNVAILGGTQVAIASGCTVTVRHGSQPGVNSALKDLSTAAAHTALHDSAVRFNAPRCHRNTRTRYLDNLERWILGEGNGYAGKHLIWLNGGAGAGKSTIMQSIVERCAWRGVILGSFFFFRTDSSRNYAEVLVPTLAYQLVRAFPAAMAVLAPVINHDPLIFKASLHTQAYELLVRPILHLVGIGIIKNTYRGVFVIDGLDECSDPRKQGGIVQVIGSILCEHHVPIRFLIASRPELVITHTFQREIRLHGIFASISLDADVDAESDIRQFVEDSFLDIVDTHPLRQHITLPWPDSLSVSKLVWKSSGHFIYAATAMKFIAASNEHPERALKVVEGLAPSRTAGPFEELDALYMHILTSAKYTKQTLQILRNCYFTGFPNTVASVCCIHDFSPEDVSLFLSDIQSLVSLTPNRMAELSIVSKHASLDDFLKDKNRSLALYITVGEYHGSFLARYFKLVDNGPYASTSLFRIRQIDALHLITYLAQAIVCAPNTDLLHSLISQHAPQDIWNFCVKSFALDTTTSSTHARDLTTSLLCRYMGAIRDSIANLDSALYIRQFKMYIQLICDDLSDSAHSKPQYRIIPALIFASSSSGLSAAYHLLYNFKHRLRICTSYQYHFRIFNPSRENSVGLHRSFEAIRSMPQTQLAWGSDLATLMTFVLHRLGGFSKRSETPHTITHRQWLRRHKPRKQISLGSPKLSSTFALYLSKSMLPVEYTEASPFAWDPLKSRHIYRYWRAGTMWTRRMKCLTLLKVVILYLHKSDCTSEVASLARRLLPKIAVTFPKLMKRARAEMDAYVHRWEESPNGLLEKAKFLSINGMD